MHPNAVLLQRTPSEVFYLNLEIHSRPWITETVPNNIAKQEEEHCNSVTTLGASGMQNLSTWCNLFYRPDILSIILPLGFATTSDTSRYVNNLYPRKDCQVQSGWICWISSICMQLISTGKDVHYRALSFLDKLTILWHKVITSFTYTGCQLFGVWHHFQIAAKSPPY